MMLSVIIGILSAVGALLGGFYLGFVYCRHANAKELKQLKAAAGSPQAEVDAAEQRAQTASDQLAEVRRELEGVKRTLSPLQEEVSTLNNALEAYAEAESSAKKTIQELEVKLAAAAVASKTEEDESTRIDDGLIQIQQDAERLKRQFDESQKLLALAQSEVKQAKKTAKEAMTKAQAEDAIAKTLKEEVGELKKMLASATEQQEEEAGWTLEEEQSEDTKGALAGLEEELAALKVELAQSRAELAAAGESRAVESKSVESMAPVVDAFATDKTASVWTSPRPAQTPQKDTTNPFDQTGAAPKSAGPSAFESANPFAHLATTSTRSPPSTKDPGFGVKEPSPREPAPRPEPKVVEAKAEAKAETRAETKREKPAVRPPKEGGPTVMDVLDTDPSLNPGIREAVRTIYMRYAPAVKKSNAAEIKGEMTVIDALQTDPNLNRGQKETIRAVLSRVAPKT